MRSLLAVVLPLLATLSLAHGQTPDSTAATSPTDRAASRPLDYRRVFFPQHLISEMPMVGRYPHISAEVFHRLADAAQQSGEHATGFDNRHILKSLELSARLDGDRQQLVAGKGVMRIGVAASMRETEAPNENATDENANVASIALAPFRLAVSDPVWNDGEPAKLGLGNAGETVLYVPSGAGELAFDWSLKGGTDSRNDLVFALDLPRFLRTQLTLDLPADRKPIVTYGIVRQDSPADGETTDIPEGFRRWQVMVGGGQSLRLIVAPDETSEVFFRSIGVSELHKFDLSLNGMELTTLFFFEKSDFVLDELILELDKPLSPLSVKSDDRALPWTVIPGEEDQPTQLLVSIPYLESGIREIQVQAFCPTQTEQMWELPRVHVRSPLFFWNETRNRVQIKKPLLPRRIESSRQRLDVFTSGVDETEGDLFVFQAFEKDSPLGFELGLKQTFPFVQSGTAFQWGDREISARAVLDISVEEGRIQQLELDIDAAWTVDLIEAADASRVANYYIEETDEESPAVIRWVVPLRNAVAPRQPIRLLVQMRRPISTGELSSGGEPAQRRRYPLSDFMPIRVHDGSEGTQLIAFDSLRQYRRIASGDRNGVPEPPAREQVRERFDEVPDGEVFAVDESGRNDFLEIEAVQPRYEMKTLTNLVLQNGYLFETCRFYCVPAENSRVSRLSVGFSQQTPASDLGAWTWGLGREPETSQQIKATKAAAPASSDASSTETWNLELTPSRSTPFEVTASRAVPFDGSLSVPLPFFAEISQAEAFVRLETRDATVYRIASNPTRAVSSNLAAEFTTGSATSGTLRSSQPEKLHAVRGVYQYEAVKATFAKENTAFVIEPVPHSREQASPDVAGESPSDNIGNIWHMALHSHYQPDGKVVSYAVLAIENRMLDHLKITLPPEVAVDDVRNVWVDHAKTTWSGLPRDGDRADNPNDDRAELVVPLPSQQRYLTMIVEYSRQGDPLSERVTLKPAMPSFEIPVFSQKWHAWYPPQYRGFDAADRWDVAHVIPKRFFQRQPDADSQFRPRLFGGESTESGLFTARQSYRGDVSAEVKKRFVACSQRTLDLLRDPALTQHVRRETSAAATAASHDPALADAAPAPELTWGELLCSNVFDDALFGSDSNDPQSPAERFTLLIDAESLVRTGFFPTTPVHSHSRTIPAGSEPERGLALLERHSLAVVFDGHHNMLLTTVPTAARLRERLVPVYSNRFWYSPFGSVFEMRLSDDPASRRVYLSPHNWQFDGGETPPHPSIFNPNLPPEVYRPGWAVFESVYDADAPPSLLLVRKNTRLAHQLCVFLLILLCSWRLRFDHTVWLVVLLITVIIVAGLVPSYFSGIASSAFWGLLCAITFSLIRHTYRTRATVVSEPATDQTTIITLRLADDDSEPGEVRRPATYARPPNKPPVVKPGGKLDNEPAGDTEIDTVSQPADNIAKPDVAKPDQPNDSNDSRTFGGGLLPLLLACCIIFSQAAGQVMGQVAGQTSVPNVASPLRTPVPDNIREILESDEIPSPYRVFIPYDRQGNLGKYYHVPEKMYEELRRIERGTANSGNWLISKARYVGTLMQDPVQNETVLFNLRAIYDIELFDHATTIRLPEMPLVHDGVRCDNQLLQPTVAPSLAGDGNDCIFVITGRGGHQLEISLLPTVYDYQDTMSRRFDFPVPAVADSTLELMMPNANLSVDVLQSLGRVSRTTDRLTADLGPTSRLSVSWPIRPSSPINVAASQYFRFHSTASQTKLQASYRFSVSSGSIRHVLLNVDPRYRQEGAFRAIGEEIESDEPVPGSDNLRRITFRNPVTNGVTIEAVYVPKNISGIGTLPLPQFSAEDARIDRSWLGVSSDPSMETELPLSNVETKLFENDWGGTDEPVHHAYDLLRPQDDWFLTVRSRPIYRQVEQRQWFLLRSPSIAVAMQADVTPTYGRPSGETTLASPPAEAIPVFLHELVLPEGFQCDAVEIRLADGTLCDAPRIERNGRDMILFFKEPVSGKYTVTVSGSMPCDPDSDFSLPLFGHGENSIVGSSLFCYRDTSVLVQQPPVDSSVRRIDAVPNPVPNFPSGTFLSAFRVESPEEFRKSTVSIRQNKPKITGVMVSRLERNYTFDHWDMVITWDLTITEGELDQVYIFIPVRLGGETLTVLPNVPFRQIEKTDGTLVQLDPRDHMSGEQFFGIRFPLGGTLDAVSVPNVQLQHDCDLEQYVALPERPANKSLTWALTNLVSTDFVPPIRPEHLRMNDPAAIQVADATMTRHYYRVTRPDFTARITSSNESPVVLCHDVTCFVKRNGFRFGVSVFDIQGNDATHCDIVFPEEYQLMQLQLNDIYPLPEHVDESMLRVDLLSDVPVQRLTATYCSRRQVASANDSAASSAAIDFSEGEKQTRLPLPYVLAAPVRNNVWEVYFEPPPYADERIDVALNLTDDQDVMTPAKEMRSLPQAGAGNLRIRMELVRMNQALTFLRMLSLATPNGKNLTDRSPDWNHPWLEKRQRTARLLSEWNADEEGWDDAFFLGRPDATANKPDDEEDTESERAEWNTDLSFVENCVSAQNTPQSFYSGLVEQYEAFMEVVNRSESPVEPAASNMDREFFMTHFWDDPGQVRYVAGAAAYRMTEIRLTEHAKKDLALRGFYFNAILWGTVFLAVTVLAINRRTRLLLQRFSILFVIVLIVFCSLFVAPGPVGWGVLIVLFLSAVRAQWNQMRVATAVISRERPPVIADDEQ